MVKLEMPIALTSPFSTSSSMPWGEGEGRGERLSTLLIVFILHDSASQLFNYSILAEKSQVYKQMSNQTYLGDYTRVIHGFAKTI